MAYEGLTIELTFLRVHKAILSGAYGSHKVHISQSIIVCRDVAVGMGFADKAYHTSCYDGYSYLGGTGARYQS